jgi:hypothetical protein
LLQKTPIVSVIGTDGAVKDGGMLFKTKLSIGSFMSSHG